MRITCPNCAAEYEVADSAIPPEGRDVQCSECHQVWFQAGFTDDAPSSGVEDAPDVAEDGMAGTSPRILRGDDDPEPDDIEGSDEVLSPGTPEVGGRTELDPKIREILEEEARREEAAREAERARARSDERAPSDDDDRTVFDVAAGEDLGLEDEVHPADDAVPGSIAPSEDAPAPFEEIDHDISPADVITLGGPGPSVDETDDVDDAPGDTTLGDVVTDGDGNGDVDGDTRDAGEAGGKADPFAMGTMAAAAAPIAAGFVMRDSDAPSEPIDGAPDTDARGADAADDPAVEDAADGEDTTQGDVIAPPVFDRAQSDEAGALDDPAAIFDDAPDETVQPGDDLSSAPFEGDTGDDPVIAPGFEPLERDAGDGIAEGAGDPSDAPDDAGDVFAAPSEPLQEDAPRFASDPVEGDLAETSADTDGASVWDDNGVEILDPEDPADEPATEPEPAASRSGDAAAAEIVEDDVVLDDVSGWRDITDKSQKTSTVEGGETTVAPEVLLDADEPETIEYEPEELEVESGTGAATSERVTALRRRQGFRYGFGLSVLAVVALVMIYVARDSIVPLVPALEGPIAQMENLIGL